MYYVTMPELTGEESKKKKGVKIGVKIKIKEKSPRFTRYL